MKFSKDFQWLQKLNSNFVTVLLGEICVCMFKDVRKALALPPLHIVLLLYLRNRFKTSGTTPRRMRPKFCCFLLLFAVKTTYTFAGDKGRLTSQQVVRAHAYNDELATDNEESVNSLNC